MTRLQTKWMLGSAIGWPYRPWEREGKSGEEKRRSARCVRRPAQQRSESAPGRLRFTGQLCCGQFVLRSQALAVPAPRRVELDHHQRTLQCWQARVRAAARAGVCMPQQELSGCLWRPGFRRSRTYHRRSRCLRRRLARRGTAARRLPTASLRAGGCLASCQTAACRWLGLRRAQGNGTELSVAGVARGAAHTRASPSPPSLPFAALSTPLRTARARAAPLRNPSRRHVMAHSLVMSSDLTLSWRQI